MNKSSLSPSAVHGKRLIAVILVLAVAAGAAVAEASVSPTTQASAASFNAICWKPNPKIPGSSTTVWTGKNPKDCKARYQLYDTSRGRGALVLDIAKNGTSSVSFWAAIQKGYAAAQKWCSQNSLTCTVIVSVGVALVAPLASAARG
jgi:hypothetical protein